MADRFPKPLQCFALITLMASLAIAQPLFDLLGRQAEFLVAHGLDGWQLVIFALETGLGFPLLIATLALPACKSGTMAGRLVFYLLFIVLATLISLPIAIAIALDGVVAVFAAIGAAVLIALLYRSAGPVRLFFSYLTPAVLIFPLVLLFFSRATPLLTPDSGSSGPPHSSLGSVPGSDLPDIVFLVLDEFPLVSLLTGELEINRERFPNFARLADQSNWYLAATTGAEDTVHAIPEALTGVESEPGSEQLPIAAHFPRNLFTLLQDHYRLNVMETATRLCPRQACSAATGPGKARQASGNLFSDLLLIYRHIITPSPWAESLPSVSDAWSGFDTGMPAETGTDLRLEEALAKADLSKQMRWNSRSLQFREFVSGIEDSGQPGLHYLHTLLPHRIWRYLPDGRQYLLEEVWAALDPPHARPGALDGSVFGHRWQEDELAVNTALQRHLLQVRFVDRLLGELLDRMQGQGMLRDSIVVVMGDHGASFMPGQPRRAITQENLTDISAVPLMIKLPGQVSGNRITSPAALVDILPTMADAMGITLNWPFSGSSLLRNGRAERATITVKKTSGASVSYAPEQHLQHLGMRALQNEAILGRGNGAEFYAIGEYSELIGTSPADYETGRTDSVQVLLDSPQLYRQVDPDGNFVPRHVTGTLESTAASPAPVQLLVAVNGIIQASTRTYEIAGFEDRFEAMLPPGALSSGENTMQVYQVSQTAGQTRLTELTHTPPGKYHLGTHEDRFYITDERDRDFAVNTQLRTGQAITIEDEGAALIRLTGNVPQPMRQVVAFIDGRYAGSSEARDRLFTILLNAPQSRRPAESELRVFALGESTATELNYPQPCHEHWHFAPPSGWSGVDCSVTAVNPLRWQQGSYRAELDFRKPDIRPYMGDGWQFQEGSISWATGQRADLEIPIPNGLDGIRFAARVQPFLAPPSLAEQSIFLLANEQQVASWTLKESRQHDLQWEVHANILARKDGALTLSFLMPDAASPKSLDAGEDLRILGMAFLTMNMEADGAEPPPLK